MKLEEVEQKYKLINKLILDCPENKIEYLDLFMVFLRHVEP
jgi:hypothetical protein